jgi:hypothetical protein
MFESVSDTKKYTSMTVDSASAAVRFRRRLDGHGALDQANCSSRPLSRRTFACRTSVFVVGVDEALDVAEEAGARTAVGFRDGDDHPVDTGVTAQICR